MSLAVVVDTLAPGLTAATGATASDREPTVAADLPHLTITIDNATQPLVGIGEIPRGPRTGSLAVTSDVDLTHPTRAFGDDTVDLVSGDRRTFIVPNGPVVRREEVVVTDDDGPYAFVDTAPAGRQFSVDVELGELSFGQALPGTGRLRIEFFIGMWDVTTVRYSGDLGLTAFGADAASVATLSRTVADALQHPEPAFARITPIAWGAVREVTVGDDPANSQIVRYRFDFELEQPSLPTGGGVIRTVAVTSATDGSIEQFDVTHEGSDA
jgi:hypothetical protein